MHNKGKLVTKLAYKLYDLSAVDIIVTYFLLNIIEFCDILYHGKYLPSSNGNDIETKRNNSSIIGVFSVSKRNELAYSRTLKDRSKANIFMSILCRIEVNTNWVGRKLSRIEQKRAGLVQNFPGSNKNELG